MLGNEMICFPVSGEEGRGEGACEWMCEEPNCNVYHDVNMLLRCCSKNRRKERQGQERRGKERRAKKGERGGKEKKREKKRKEKRNGVPIMAQRK